MGEDIAHDLAYGQVSSSDMEVCLGIKINQIIFDIIKKITCGSNDFLNRSTKYVS